MINGNVLSQIDATAKGIHLFWTGPFSWVYAPGGWSIQRREFSRRKQFLCETIAGTLITRLKNEAELRLPFGWLSYRTGKFDENTPAEIYRLDLDEPSTMIRMTVTAKLGFSFALHRGKVVAAISPKNSGSFTINFSAGAIDAVVSYFLGLQSIQYCVLVPEDEGHDSWNEIPYLVKNLQLPIVELDPSLHNPDEEFEKAKSRLLPGEDIDRDEFTQLTDILRNSVKTGGYPRHIDKIILLREDETAGFEELNATAPLLSIISHPKWRRVMGFGWFDHDTALQPDLLYEYRVTGFFPAEDLYDKVYGFHTLSSSTLLPSSFLLGNLMLRFSQPPHIELAPETIVNGKIRQSRRGIVLQDPHQTFWTFPVLQNWSLVIDFPTPANTIQLELLQGHSLEYEARNSANALVSPLQSLPTGEIVQLVFTSAVSQLRLKGMGLLYTIRTTQPLNGIQPFYLLMPPVLFAKTEPPALPGLFEARNLQEIAAENTQEDGIHTTAARSALGFQLQWEASLQHAITYWPDDEMTPPPVESTIYQIEHKQLPDTEWQPILPEENWVLGNRRKNETAAAINQGTDLMQLFPEAAVTTISSDLHMYWDDIFDFFADDAPVIRPVPPLGTTHQYRIRAVDVIGRPSEDWLESNQVELRKLIPPPVPVGPVPVVNDEPDFASPNGVHARLLVKDAPDLTPAEETILGNDMDVIQLRWGWHKEQRDLDPLVTEFRIYIHDKSLDVIEGELLSVTPLGPGRFEASFQMERLLKNNVLRESFIQLGGYPFYVESHDAGTTGKMILHRRLPDENGVLSGPAPGHVTINLMIGSDRLQPNAWSGRIAVVPLTQATSYNFELRNALALSAEQRRAELWLGVSANDNQPYVEDKLAPLENRKGNESPIVPVKIQARFWGRPAFDVPPPLEAVPRLITREPAGTPVRLNLDITAFLDPGKLGSATHIRLERVHAGIVFNHYKVMANNSIAAISPQQGQPDVEIPVPNPDDKENILAALRQPDAGKLEDQYLVYLAGSHPYRAAFFEPVTPDPVLLGSVTDTYLPQTNRYVYRVRTGNAAGLISSGDAMLKMVVRIPSVRPGPIPELVTADKSIGAGMLQLRVRPDDSVTHIILFYSPAIAGGRGPGTKGALLRIANRPDLYPDRMLKFRNPQGDFAEQLVKDINDPTIETEEDGARLVTFSIDEETDGEWTALACTLTRDGTASDPGGPWRIQATVPQP